MSRIIKYFKLKSSTIVRHFRDSHTMILISLMSLVLPLLTAAGKCQLEDRVKLALKTMSHSTVPAVVDCVVDNGPCDVTGDWIKMHAVYVILHCGQLGGLNYRLLIHN